MAQDGAVIEVGVEPWSRDMVFETRITEESHLVVETWVPWLESLRDRVGNPRLFLAQNRFAGTWGLMHWVWGPMDKCPPCVRVASGLEAFQGEPNSWPWPEGLLDWGVLVPRMAPSYGKFTLREQLLARKRAREQRSHEMMMQREEVAKRYERQGDPVAARSVRSSPYAVDEGSQAVTEDLKRAAAGRVYSYGG